MKVLLIRHGATAGNLEKRYVGSRTDERLTDEEKTRFKKAEIWAERPEGMERWEAEPISEIHVSPMKRCTETAGLIFSGEPFKRCMWTEEEGLKECDFGRFEYKNYMDLNGDEDYQRFIDSGGLWGFPGGEEIRAFRSRCVNTFGNIVGRKRDVFSRETEETMAFVVHGGTVMAVMEAFAVPKGEYFSWQVKNGCGYLCSVVLDEASPFGFHLADVAKISVL